MELDSYLSEKHKRKQKKRRYILLPIALLASYLAFFGAFWIIFRSPLFRVSAVKVSGNDTVPAGAVIDLLEASALRGHSFRKALEGFRNMFFWPDALSQGDLAFIPRLASVTVAKDFLSRTITANVRERAPFGIWCAMREFDPTCYSFDDRGTTFAKTFDTEGGLMVSIHDYTGDKVGLNGKILPPPLLDNMLSVVRAVQASGITVKEAAVKDIDLQEVMVATYEGPTIYFSLHFPADEYLPVLQDLMKKPGFGKLSYIDFRVEHRVFYQ